MPLVSAFRWDTGVQVHSAASWVDAAGAVTTGSLANPLVGDDNGGKQLAGRVAVHPEAGLLIGVSAARGQFLSRAAAHVRLGRPSRTRSNQTAIGADAEYSRDYYLIRAEAVAQHVDAADHRRTAGRHGRLGRRALQDPSALVCRRAARPLDVQLHHGVSRTAEWEAPVTRLEFGGGYLLQRNLQLKASFQRNTREGGRVTHLKIGSAQLVFWF